MSGATGRLAGKSAALQWVALLVLSLVFVAVALAVRLPAALMIGPMVAAIFVGTSDGTIRVPMRPMIAVQGVIGFLMGRAIPLTFLEDLARDWPLLLMGLAGVIVAASVIGLALTRWGGLPGTTGVWGISAGASTPMIIMSMQSSWFPPVAWLPFLASVALAVASASLAAWLRVPAGPMLVPLALAVVLQETGLLMIELHPLLLATCYAIVGWNVGLRFTRPIVWYAFRALPIILGATFALIAACGLLAWAMVLIGDVDPLTAFLATSPGGADTIAIIAASSAVDMRFVMAMQTTRLVVVLLMAPGLSRLLARWSGGGNGASPPPP
jgi:uncharacterized protein